MQTKHPLIRVVGLAAAFFLHSLAANAAIIDLGTAGSFAVLAGTTVTNTGSSTISGDVGVSPGTAITGFPPGVVTDGTVHLNDAVAQQAQLDLTTAYNNAAAQACTTNLTGMDLGGMTLLPGVYCFSASAQLTGNLTLDSSSNPNGSYLFQMGSTLTTASNSMITFLGVNDGSNVFFQVGSSATLGTNSAFAGNILALTSITLTTGASINCGSALARNGAVTLDTNDINACPATNSSAVPEPSTYALIAGSLIGLQMLRKRK